MPVVMITAITTPTTIPATAAVDNLASGAFCSSRSVLRSGNGGCTRETGDKLGRSDDETLLQYSPQPPVDVCWIQTSVGVLKTLMQSRTGVSAVAVTHFHPLGQHHV